MAASPRRCAAAPGRRRWAVDGLSGAAAARSGFARLDDAARRSGAAQKGYRLPPPPQSRAGAQDRKGRTVALEPDREAFVTCALTGAGDTTGRSDKAPVTPAEIAEAGIEAARAGAAVVHVHVRDPETGRPARDPALYREVVERVRGSGVDVVPNLTAGMGGDLTLGPADRPLPPSQAGTDMAGAEERLAHVAELLPEICTLDCGTMNFGEGDYIMTNTPAMLADMAKCVQAPGVRPEIEVFDTGHLVLAKWPAGARSTSRRWCSSAWASPGARRTISARSCRS